MANALRKRKNIHSHERSQKRARNQDEKKRKVKDSPKKNETTLYVNIEDEHSLPDCVKQIEFKIVADKGTQTEKVIRHIHSSSRNLEKYIY